jgi:HEAT repeat protein
VAVFFCPACWAEVPEKAALCPTCGADLETLDRAEFDQKLIRALDHPEALTAVRAAEILGWRRTARAVPALLARYRRGADPFLAAAIALALGRIGGVEARAALRELERDPSVIVRRAAREAARILDERRAGE